MSIGDPITQPIPAVSTPGTGYASQLKSFLDEVKSRLEQNVPLSSLASGTFDQDNNPVINLQYAQFYEQTDTSSEPVGAIFNYQGNLWYVSSSGAAQITAGNALNAAGISGIGGDYGGVNPALVTFSDADKTYYFYDNFGALEWARLAARSIDIYGTLTETERVRITWPGGSNWELTLPAAPPAANGTLLQMDTAGAVTAANTGLDSITLASNEDVTISGTGRFKHGTRQHFVNLKYMGGTVTGFGNGLTGAWGMEIPAGGTAYFHLPDYRINDRIETIRFDTDSSASPSITYSLMAHTSGAGGGTQSTITTSTSSSAQVTLTVNTTLTSNAYYLKVVNNSGTDAVVILGTLISWSAL